MNVCLKRDINEMRTAKRIYWRTCWRIVSAEDKETTQLYPYAWSKKEAREQCEQHGYKIIGEIL